VQNGMSVLCAAAAAAIGASVASAEPPTTQQLLDKINALQAEVDQLKAERQPGPHLMPAESQAVVDAVQADAERHSRLLDVQGLTGGYLPDKGFALRSDNGDFLLHPWLLFQFRDETTYRGDGKPGGRSDVQNGFEIRRLKLGLDGNLFGPDLTYQFIWSVDRHSGNFLLEDAWARYDVPGTALFVRGGQIRDPFDHEQIVFGPFLLTSERSLVNSIFANGDGLVQGATVGFDNNGPLRVEGGITDGMRSANTNFQDFPTAGIPADWGLAGRVEFKPMGDWKQYNGFTALGAKRPLLVFGAGADYTEAGDTQQLTHVADVQYDHPDGLMFYGAYLGRYVNHNGGPPGTNGGFTGTARTPDTYDTTVRAEAGYLVAHHFEPFVRYEYIHFDGAELPATSRHSVVHEVTTGFNYYFYGQRAKFTADMSYLPSGSPVSDDSSGVLTSGARNEVVVRAQFQLIL